MKTRTINKKRLTFIGDSHLCVFQYIKDNGYLPNYDIDIKTVLGATAMGMVNPHSKTDALKKFREFLKIQDKESSLFFQIGEVDCGFIIWYRSQKHSISVEEQLTLSVNNYFTFLKEVKNKGFQKVTILGAVLPTIKDGQDLGEVANLRKEIKATQSERTKLTLRYNRLLRQFANSHDFKYADINNSLLDPSTHLVKDYYLSNNATDHHLSSRKTAPLWLVELNRIHILDFPYANIRKIISSIKCVLFQFKNR